MIAAKKAKPPMLEVSGDLEPMLTRLKLTAIRDQLDTLLDQAGRAELNLREALSMLCAAEVARKDGFALFRAQIRPSPAHSLNATDFTCTHSSSPGLTPRDAAARFVNLDRRTVSPTRTRTSATPGCTSSPTASTQPRSTF